MTVRNSISFNWFSTFLERSCSIQVFFRVVFSPCRIPRRELGTDMSCVTTFSLFGRIIAVIDIFFPRQIFSSGILCVCGRVDSSKCESWTTNAARHFSGISSKANH